MTSYTKPGVMFREPLDEFLKPINARLPHAQPHPEVMKISICQCFEVIRPSMRRSFDEVQEQYRRGSEALERERAFLKLVEANNLSWDGLDETIYGKATSQKQGNMLDCEVLSESILMTFDSLVTAVVTELTSKEKCIDVGVPTAHGVKLDRLLDAFMNFLRHRYEWRRQRYLREPYKSFQNDSIEPLALALTGLNLSGADAVDAIFDTPMPATATLDIVADFHTHQFNVTYEIAEDRVRALCDTIVDQRFEQWFKRHVEREKAETQGTQNSSSSSPGTPTSP